MSSKTDVFVEEFGTELLNAIELQRGRDHKIVDVQLCQSELMAEGEVRYRIGVEGTDGSVRWFVSEDVLFDYQNDDDSNVDLVCNVLTDTEASRIRERMLECGLIED